MKLALVHQNISLHWPLEGRHTMRALSRVGFVASKKVVSLKAKDEVIVWIDAVVSQRVETTTHVLKMWESLISLT